MRKKMLLVGFILATALLVVGSVQLALAVNKLSVNPGYILIGQKVTITLTTERAATGTITVTQNATGNSWSININVPAGTNTWTFPDDWLATNPGANTNELGYYDVLADITMKISKYTWKTQFQAGFLVIPEPFGPIMAIIACFSAVIGFRKFKAIK